jgi:sucrose phosphorylase
LNVNSGERILECLRFVYGDERAPGILAQIEGLVARHAPFIPARPSGHAQRDALLISYGDSILGSQSPLEALRGFLRAEVGDLISFVHLLPFYPFTSDDGFSVVDFRAVREDLGTWEDIERFAQDYRLVFDGVINHVSASSRYMTGYAAGDPAYADFFVALDPGTDTRSVLRTRNLPLLHDYPTREGVKWLWTTFSRDQLDLNYANPAVLLEILDVLLFYARKGASMVRLDAIPYLWKELGTSCAHLPQTHTLIRLIRTVYDLASPHTGLLTETNVPHRENLSYFGEGGDEAQMIYNFSLAPLILWSLYKGDASVLSEWARSIEFVSDRATYLNITATHDGIGMRPTEGILSHAQRMELVQLARDHGGDMTGKRNGDGSATPYELNLNYFDAVNDPRADEPAGLQVRRFMVSQAIPLALMGIPGIYIHSLLGSRNDLDGVGRTGRARSINRQQLEIGALRRELGDPESLRARVFSAYRDLLRRRAQQSAFDPGAAQRILDCGPSVFAVRRENARTGEALVALHNVTERPVSLALDSVPVFDLLARQRLDGGAVSLAPYQTRWLERVSSGG